MGSKRNKLKTFSPAKSTLHPPTTSPEDDDLMNDLIAELDSRDNTVQAESAAVLNDMQLNQQAQQIDISRKRDPQSRFQARQVMACLISWGRVYSSMDCG